MSSIVKSLGLRYPIIQAPMAGGSCTTSLISQVCNFGALGSIPSAYQSIGDLHSQIKEIKKLSKPFVVNAFIPHTINYSQGNEEKVQQIVNEKLKKMNNNTLQYSLPTQQQVQQDYELILDLVLKEKPPIFSFTFGVPEKCEIKELKEQNIFVIGTATCVEEGVILQEYGCDAVIAQGYESGGHRGTFLEKNVHNFHSSVGLISLIPAMVDTLKIPVIASGGIMDARGIRACMALGASLVQMGSIFLCTEESGIPNVYKEALIKGNEDDTQYTNAFSGRFARGISNEFMDAFSSQNDVILDFPLQNSITSALRKQAAIDGRSEFLSLWTGQGVRQIKDIRSVNSVLSDLVKGLEM